MMIPVNIGLLQKASASRKPGYLDAVMGKSVPDQNHPGFVLITKDDYKTIGDQFEIVSGAAAMVRDKEGFFGTKAIPGITVERRGLGDMIHSVAGPIGKAISWPCMKGDDTTDLKPGSPCDKVKTTLNKILPNL